MERRHFIAASAALATSTGISFADADRERRVGIIGHSGRGNFGHGLGRVWLDIPNARIVGVADGGKGGPEKELGKLKLDDSLGFSDYRRMLVETKPEFVSVAPRHPDQHKDMCLAAIAAGVRGLYVEKPFLRMPRECDEVLAAAEKAGAKIAVAHRNRYHPALQEIDALIRAGKLGKLLEIRGRGKGDRRGGAEDLWVLGTHTLNLVSYFGGAPKTCSAMMLQDGRRVTKADVVPEGAEGLGPLAGNELHARYELEGGVFATFDSIANDGTKGQGFGLVLVGSEGLVNIQNDRNPLAHFLPGNPYQPNTKPSAWQPITTGGVNQPEAKPGLVDEVRHHVEGVRDLIAAVDEKGRQPLCDGRAAAETVEMVCAVFESHRQNSRAVSFPLKQRGNALALLGS